jgi:PAS domain S-box-containing protein/diguanylate cyclase (GGDEF)-like protein
MFSWRRAVAQRDESDREASGENKGRPVVSSRPDLDSFAQRWAQAIRGTSFVAMNGDELLVCLRGFTEQLVQAVQASDFDPAAGRHIGVSMVLAHFTGAETLGRTLTLLIEELPHLLDQPAAPEVTRRVARLSGSLAAGYASTLREHSLDEQDAIYRAGLRARRQAEQALAASEARFREVFYSSPVAFAISDTRGRVVQANRALEELVGCAPGGLVGRSVGELFPAAQRSLVLGYYEQLVSGRRSRFRQRVLVRVAGGEMASVVVVGSVLVDEQQAPAYVVTMVDDVSDLRLLEQRLQHQSLHDGVTGLANRQYLRTHLERVLAGAPASAVVTLVWLDLEGFGVITTGLGEAVGDQVLTGVARRLEALWSQQAPMIARMGGDEYAVLFAPSPHPPPVNELGMAITHALSAPLPTPLGWELPLGASIAVVQQPAGQGSAEQLLQQAATTLHRLRTQDRGRAQPHQPHLDEPHQRLLELAAQLPTALRHGQLQLRYQPIRTLQGHQLVGLHAHLHWMHPQRGLIPDEHCRAAAEHTSTPTPLTAWMLRTSATHAHRWHTPIMIALTPRQAHDPTLLTTVRDILTHTPLAPHLLHLYAPATSIRTPSGHYTGQTGQRTETTLRQLHQLGIPIGLHSFAGGIGAMRCIAELPLTSIHIAAPIAHHVATDPTPLLSQAVREAVQLVRSAGVNVIACPVDTPEQASSWPRIGANWGIGELLGAPTPPEHITTLLTSC